jgi:hypothetical protein
VGRALDLHRKTTEIETDQRPAIWHTRHSWAR